MLTWELTVLLAAGSLFAGFLGALTGLGGGVIIVPLLTLVFGVDLRYAIGASLVSVIATSSGASAAYVKEGFSNMRAGMFLEVATTSGALTGAFLAAWMPTSLLSIVFGVVLLASAAQSLRKRAADAAGEIGSPDPLATRLRMDSTVPTPDGPRPYHVRRVPLGGALMFIAGGLSGMLGIGSGALKVLAMDQAMRLPFKVSTTTSNFMIGVTAAASAGVYLHRGYIDPGLSMPVMLGVLVGALCGARLLPKANIGVLRWVFGVVVVLMAVQMIISGLGGQV